MMIDPAIAALLGAVIGASAGIAGGVVLEAFKRRRDRQGTASAIAGEVSSVLFMVERRKYVAFFEALLPRLDSGENVPIAKFAPGADHRDPVAEAYLDKLGLLPRDVPERVVRFYSMVAGIRRGLERMATEGDMTPATKAVIIRDDLALWRDATLLGTQLVAELRQIAGAPQWLA